MNTGGASSQLITQAKAGKSRCAAGMTATADTVFPFAKSLLLER